MELKDLTSALVRFRDERDWQQFHNPKDLAIGLNVEAGELLEQFLWKMPGEENTEAVKEELADVLSFCFLMAHHYGWDIPSLIQDKMLKNADRYPVEKAKGSNKKYNEL